MRLFRARSTPWRSRPRWVPLAALLVLLPAVSHAADPVPVPPPVARPDPDPAEQPSVTTASYGDWLVRCTQAATAPTAAVGRQLCEVVQGIQAAERPGLLAQIAFGRIGPTEPLRLVVQLPLGVWLPSGATLSPSADLTTGFVAQFTVCRQGCLASVVVARDRLTELTAASGPGRLAFVDATGQTVVLPVSLRGLKAALDAYDTNPGER